MTKKEAIKAFREIAAKMDRTDRPSLREAWNNYTDTLCKAGQITTKQYDTWDQPDFVR